MKNQDANALDKLIRAALDRGLFDDAMVALLRRIPDDVLDTHVDLDDLYDLTTKPPRRDEFVGLDGEPLDACADFAYAYLATLKPASKVKQARDVMAERRAILVDEWLMWVGANSTGGITKALQKQDVDDLASLAGAVLELRLRATGWRPPK